MQETNYNIISKKQVVQIAFLCAFTKQLFYYLISFFNKCTKYLEFFTEVHEITLNVKREYYISNNSEPSFIY